MTQPDAALMRGQWSEAELTERGWTLPDIAELRYLREQEQELPDTAPKALLSIRLSVLSEESTSPVRQELDLYRFCIERGSRAVGVARDLGVSATKSAPWERPELGDWINNRSPEFDEILFWKLDRFVRRVSDLHLMIEWCTCYSKTLASKMDPVDLTKESGRHLGIILAGMARIEGANTGVRVESLWTYSRTASRWVIGKPVYGYTTVKRDGGRFLEIDPTKHRTLRWIYSMLQRNYSLYRICKILNRTDFLPPNKGKWSSGNLKVILINPTLMGYRVYRPKDHKQGNPPLVSQTADGRPIRIAEPIFSEEGAQEYSGPAAEKTVELGKNLQEQDTVPRYHQMRALWQQLVRTDEGVEGQGREPKAQPATALRLLRRWKCLRRSQSARSPEFL